MSFIVINEIICSGHKVTLVYLIVSAVYFVPEVTGLEFFFGGSKLLLPGSKTNFVVAKLILW